jgi:hypothetical protein
MTAPRSVWPRIGHCHSRSGRKSSGGLLTLRFGGLCTNRVRRLQAEAYLRTVTPGIGNDAGQWLCTPAMNARIRVALSRR